MELLDYQHATNILTKEMDDLNKLREDIVNRKRRKACLEKSAILVQSVGQHYNVCHRQMLEFRNKLATKVSAAEIQERELESCSRNNKEENGRLQNAITRHYLELNTVLANILTCKEELQSLNSQKTRIEADKRELVDDAMNKLTTTIFNKVRTISCGNDTGNRSELRCVSVRCCFHLCFCALL